MFFFGLVLHAAYKTLITLLSGLQRVKRRPFHFVTVAFSSPPFGSIPSGTKKKRQELAFWIERKPAPT
jgi:hypothetical protein